MDKHNPTPGAIMKIKPAVLATVGALATLSMVGVAHAAIVSQELSGSATTAVAYYWGETFTTAAGGPWQDLSVNFYAPSGAPLAGGVGYIFSGPYGGTPGGLASAGALATSVVTTGGSWQFAPSFTLAASTEYFFTRMVC
jgi:hypothetical protein